jgi:acetyl esterase/lipase
MLVALVASWVICGMALAGEPVATVNLWPGTPPGDTKDLGPEKTVRGMLTNVSTPTISVYKPQKEKDSHVAIIVAPGGGFSGLAMEHEGTQVCDWLNSIGITGVLLKYRVPNREGMPRYMAAMQDGQRAMSIVRSRAKQWDIDPTRIGIIGFSAGGQLAADVETNFDKRVYEPVDGLDKTDTRPDFAILVYPGGIAPRDGSVGLTPDVRVSSQTPPTILIVADNDRSENSVYMYLALKKAKVPAEMHIYGEGGHGFGMHKSDQPHAMWTSRVEDWLKMRKIYGSNE